MNSSTSSSRKIYGKILLGVGLTMAGAWSVLMMVADIVGANAEGVMGRVVQARRALPQIVSEDKKQVMVFGSSMVDAGFSPRLFDAQVKAQGKDIKSYNFGFGGLNPYFQDYLSRRIREAYQGEDKRLKLAIIEFNPFQTTQTRWNRANSMVDSFLTMLASNAELLAVTKGDLNRAMLLFNIKYVRNDISSQMVTTFMGRGIFPAERVKRERDDEAMVKRRRELGKQANELYAADFPDLVRRQWSLPLQGGRTIPQDRSAKSLEVYAEYIKTQQTAAQMTNFRNRRIRTADVLGLNFEPLLVESFIRIVENFKQFSDKVEVVMLPRNTDWINYSPEAQARLNSAIAQIEKGTGLSIRNHQNLEQINPQMFRDATHLARYQGDIVYTQFLVEQYIGDL
ncbi:MAG: hypothetical protein HRT35_12285 [Algicola sp.]|nr:hypothetical protein [Algicola sp.]